MFAETETGAEQLEPAAATDAAQADEPTSYVSEKTPAAELKKTAPRGSNRALIDMILGLAGIVLLILVIGWALKRFSNLSATGKSGKMSVTGTLAVGTRERIVMIEVEDEKLLVGVTPQQVNLIHVLPNRQAAEAVSPEFHRESMDFAPDFGVAASEDAHSYLQKEDFARISERLRRQSQNKESKRGDYDDFKF